MKQSMMIYASDWNGKETFKMLPVDVDCPYNEVIYDPENKVLAIISKEFKEKPQLFPKMTPKGDLIVKRTDNPEKKPYVEERLMMDTYYEYYIKDSEDIKSFIQHFAGNPTHKLTELIE